MSTRIFRSFLKNYKMIYFFYLIVVLGNNLFPPFYRERIKKINEH